MHEVAAGVVSGRDAEENDMSEHLANDIDLTDYAQELAFLPDLTEITVTALNYTGPNVQNKDLDVGQQEKLVDVLKRHEKIMISSGNSLPPPAYGVVASPIVIVLKKNGVDIRLCIDYKMVNAVTAIMEYVMPLVDDHLTDMEAYLWFRSLDAASGFWAIMMTERARKISAFVCALGHFEWLQMQFGLNDAPMIYQRMIDNALWGFVQPKGGWSQFAKAMQAPPRARTKFEADRESSTIMDAVSLLVNSPAGDMFATASRTSLCWFRCSTDDPSATTYASSKVDFLSHEVSSEGIRADPKKIKTVTEVSFPTSKKGMQSFLGALNYYSRFIQEFAVYGAALYQLKDADFAPGGDLTAAKRSFVPLQQKVMDAPILRHFDRVKADAEMNYHPAEKEISALLLLLKVCYTQLAEWTTVTAASAYLEATTMNLAEDAGMNNGVQAALEHATEALVIVGDSRRSSQLRSVKYLHVVQEFNAAVDSLASETLESKVSNVVSTETRLSELVALNRIQDVIYEPTAKAEIEDKPSGNTIRAHVRTGSPHRRTFVDFVQDDTETGRLTVITRQQAKVNEKQVRFASETSVAARRKADSQDKANDTPTKAQSLVREEQRIAEDSTSTVPSANEIDLQRELRRRIALAQDEGLRWSNLKTVLRGEASQLGYRAARDSWKMSDQFTLSEDNVLYYLGTSRRKSDRQLEETILRLIVHSTMVQEVLQNCHDSLEGGHQGIARTFNRIKQDYYWIGLYADVERHFRWYSPGNVLAERSFQLVSMDFVIPLTKSRRGNTALLLFQCAFTGFEMGKAMADTTLLCVAKAFEECVYRRFGAPTMILHDRDPRFMSEANGQQERSVKTVMQSVRVYAEAPLQQDWDEIAEKLIFAINNSIDSTRKEIPFYLVHGKETPFYLVHGWGAQSTLRAMTSSLKRGSGKKTDALAWRREVNRQQEIALEMAKEYQATEKSRRARKHNEALNVREQAAIPSTDPTELSDEAHSVSGAADDSPVTAPRPLFEPGDRVWLYMERVKPGLTKKLAHRWHGPFRVKRKVEEFAYELELSDRSGYRLYPVVHVSRLKAVSELGSRPKSRLTPEVTEETRLDFDEELLPEDSWEPDQLAGEYEVEVILDDRIPLSTSTERAVREFKVE
ncbi:Hypothetical protein PHPALM_20542 [Phytophthora palmivora]|uniref:Uncharacterized protein n=1 Tax=Phytophthora palmivora TaxID=4796 RepID=A0A2P4XEM6_9STRA|nr:Hypothetical protein PHPALM_20542 [Phytophthora palmivora]